MFGAGAQTLRVKSLTNIHTATYHIFSFCTKGRNTRAAAKYSNCLTKSTKHDFLQIKLFTMKKFFLILFVASFAGLILGACTQDYTENITILDDSSIKSQLSRHSITDDEAYDAVERFLEQIDPQTRGFKRTVPRGKMFTLRRSHVNRAISRGSQEDTPLLGFINLGDNSNSFSRSDSSNLWSGGNGYAVVNYNPLFGDTILIVTDIGDIQKEEIIIDDYSELPDSIINQYASLYSEELDDYYIGNVENASITNITVNWAWNYVRLRSDFIGDDNDDTIIDNSGDSGSGNGGSGGGDSGSSGSDNSSGDTSTNQPAIDTLELLSPMLQTHWGQDLPYNKNCHLYFDNKTGIWRNRLAGCVTIAAAQILAYLKNVSLSQYFGITTSSWSSLERDFTENDSDLTNRNNLSKIIKQMADGIDVKYNYNGTGGTFATPRMLKRYLKSIECNTNKHLGYGQNIENRIIQSLNNNYPVFIAALDSYCYGHAWVIDGYFRLASLPTSELSVIIDNINSNNCFMHCNMGWKGAGDGWYLSGLFSNSSLFEEYWDYTGSSTNEFCYSWCFRTLFFD